MSTDQEIGVVAPTGDGRWRAAHGIGSYTREQGRWDTEAEARAVAGAGGRRVIVAELGEFGWAAWLRDGRERDAASVGIPAGWMRDGSVIPVELTDVEALVLHWPDGRPEGVLYDMAAMPIRAQVTRARVDLADRGLLAVCGYTGEWLRGTARARECTVEEVCDAADIGDWAPTQLGLVVLGALDAGHMRHRVLVCGAAARPADQWPPVEHGPGCAWCAGQTYLGDLEPAPVRATTSLVDPVGLTEVADRLGVTRATVDQWRQRDVLPPPDATVGGRPAWSWDTIRAWAAATGRL